MRGFPGPPQAAAACSASVKPKAGSRATLYLDDVINIIFHAVREVPPDQRDGVQMAQMLRYGCRLGVKDQSDGPLEFAFSLNGDGGVEVTREKFAKWSQLRPRIYTHLRAVHGLECRDAAADGDGRDGRDHQEVGAADDDGDEVATSAAAILAIIGNDMKMRNRLKSALREFMNDNPFCEHSDEIKATHV
eukprot:4418259-Pyramimonas_sp.AAC.1